MSLPSLRAAGKPKPPIRIRPNRREGLNIQYKLKDSGFSLRRVARGLGIDSSLISMVLYGCRRSIRVEAEVARLLGRSNWNEVVLEARAATTGKSVKTLQKEYSGRWKELGEATMEQLGNVMESDRAVKARRAG
ncbi:MAG: hypothetical protein FWG29_01845 [Treponema sp.]|nr:hypothetical protein [Treponema sp.]